MLDVLYFSDRQVQARLLERVEASRGLLVVAGVQHPRGSNPIERREPFASLEQRLGDSVHFCLVADEGTPEGMWRDPLGTLSDRLFPEDREKAYAAAHHYLILRDGRPVRIVKKTGHPVTDGRALQSALSALDSTLPPAAEQRRDDAGHDDEEVTQPQGARPDSRSEPRQAPSPEATPSGDPWSLLGLTPNAPRGEARKAFRTLISQYHPDKVSHLAPEFRELAERKTRELTAAWEAIESRLPPR